MTIDLQPQLDSRAVAALREVLEIAVEHIAVQHHNLRRSAARKLVSGVGRLIFLHQPPATGCRGRRSCRNMKYRHP
ncbi:hypothetical protein [Tardiphaga sp.]|uniref:hypothetical protein n=1 Tax=Tardiphaga sp. TaxID=1926292 RepID=UPI00262C9023|nr:hypothetical protein [Tardiphaga sp.]MDB5616502.1 hypothetical protein [Tardiphaga sp.]